RLDASHQLRPSYSTEQPASRNSRSSGWRYGQVISISDLTQLARTACVFEVHRSQSDTHHDLYLYCWLTIFAWRATCFQLPPSSIQPLLNRRYEVFPAVGSFPAHTTVSLPAAMAVSPYTRTYSTFLSYDVKASVPDSIICATCCLLTNLLKG